MHSTALSLWGVGLSSFPVPYYIPVCVNFRVTAFPGKHPLKLKGKKTNKPLYAFDSGFSFQVPNGNLDPCNITIERALFQVRYTGIT